MKLLQSLYTIVDETADTFRIRLNPDHVIYQAHFPGQPITPGVCILQIIQELTERKAQQPLQLEKVTNLKFINVISPLTDQEVEVHLTSTDDWHVKGIITGEKIYTKFSIVFKN